MAWLEIASSHHLAVFCLVLARVTGLALVTPVLGAHEAPMQVRAWLVVSVALLLAPTQWGAAFEPPTTLVDMAAATVAELVVGLVLGWGVMLVFTGMQVAGALLGQASGLSLAEVFNPALDTALPLFSQVLYIFTVAIFILVGGPAMVVEGLLQTYAALPPGSFAWLDLADGAGTLLTQCFALGVRAAAPATAALVLATIVLGMISRTLPQLNIMAFGFGVNVLVTLGVLAVGLASAAWLAADELEAALDTALGALAGG